MKRTLKVTRLGLPSRFGGLLGGKLLGIGIMSTVCFFAVHFYWQKGQPRPRDECCHDSGDWSWPENENDFETFPLISASRHFLYLVRPKPARIVTPFTYHIRRLFFGNYCQKTEMIFPVRKRPSSVKKNSLDKKCC